MHVFKVNKEEFVQNIIITKKTKHTRIYQTHDLNSLDIRARIGLDCNLALDAIDAIRS